MHLIFFIAVTIFCQSIFPSQDTVVGPESAKILRIAHIYYSGNNTSKSKIIQMALDLDTGMIYDSAQIEQARKRLEYFDMFSKISIVPDIKSDGVDLFVSLKEPFYLTFGGNLDYYSYRYGEQGYWYAPRLGYEDINFRGQFEDLKFIFRVSGLQVKGDSWDELFKESSLHWLQWQLGYLSWTKPLLPSHYFVGASFIYNQRPDELQSFNKNELTAQLSFGKRLQGRSKISVSLIPDLQRRILINSSADSTRVFQTFGAVAYSIDRKEPFFDPDRGWSLSTELRSNYLYSQAVQKYFQYTLDTRYYYPGFINGEKLALRAMTILRNSDAGSFNKLFLGSTTTIRGYDQNEIGLHIEGNDIFLMSSEYRFTMCHLPSIRFSFPRALGKIVSYATEFHLRLDGALVGDYGIVSGNIYDLMNQSGSSRQSGTALGFSLRLLEMSLRGRVNFDVVWNTDPTKPTPTFYSYPSLNINADIGF